LRLAVVSPFVDRRHGTERALAELLERLAGDYGCEIHLFAQQADDEVLAPSRRENAGTQGTIVWHKVPRAPGPPLVKFLAWFQLNRMWRFAFSKWRRVSFDLVLSPGMNCSDARVILVHALFHRLKQLSEDARASSLERYGLLRRLHRRAYYALMTRLERRIYSNPGVLLAAVSTRTAVLLQEKFHRRNVAVIPNGVDTRTFSPAARKARCTEARLRHGYQEEEFVLLLMGNDWSVKGLPAVLSAVAACSILPLRVLVVGNDVAEPYQALAQRLGILDRCTWASPNPDALSFYAAADAYVSPTLEDAFALPPLEAMACGLPVITSVNNGGSEIISHGVNGFVLQEPSDVQALAELVQRLYHDVSLRKAIGEAAAKTAAQMSWDHNARAIWELLQSAVTTE
jgi:glycosyltransferase involved in cell wall biosynthesis